MNSVDTFAYIWCDGNDYITAHTSGSTGTPKPIQLAKSDMINSARATNKFFGIDSSSFLICPLSIDYIAGKMMWVRGWVAQAEVLFIESRELFSGYQPERMIDLLPIVPAQTDDFLKSPVRDFTKNLLVGGSAMSAEQEQKLAKSGISAYASYGMTETCSHIALRRIGVDDYFTALEGYVISTDSRGCLVIDNREATYGKIVTNDLVEIISSRCFRVVGRYDNVIISGGVKISPEINEALVAKQFSACRFYFTSRKSERWGDECVAVLECPPDPIVDAEFLAACQSSLPRHHIPKEIYHLLKFPVTSSGKIKRSKY